MFAAAATTNGSIAYWPQAAAPAATVPATGIGPDKNAPQDAARRRETATAVGANLTLAMTNGARGHSGTARHERAALTKDLRRTRQIREVVQVSLSGTILANPDSRRPLMQGVTRRAQQLAASAGGACPIADIQ
ncbi:MAG: hypothetical protein AB7G48_18585 [Nitrospiraceae bacterium]